MSNRGTGKRTNIDLICLKPLSITSNESVSLRCALNSVYLGEKRSQLFTGFSLGKGPQPAHSFMLEMIQTSLNCYLWPDQPHGSQSGPFTVSSNKSWVQSFLLEADKPGIGLQKGLFLHIPVSNNLLIYPIHKIQQAAILMKIGRVVKHIVYLRIIDWFHWYLLKPIVLNAIKGKSTIARELAKPPDRVALDNPQLEPVLEAVDTIIVGFPNKGVLT